MTKNFLLQFIKKARTRIIVDIRSDVKYEGIDEEDRFDLSTQDREDLSFGEDDGSHAKMFLHL